MRKDLLYSKPLQVINDFKFNNLVASVFSNMINRSVPGYKTTLILIKILSSIHFKNNTNIFDVGCSLGASSEAIINGIKDKKYHLYAIDLSEHMIKKCKKNILNKYPKASVSFLDKDVKNVIFKNASLVVFNFTLQFILPNEKDDLIQKVYDGMSKNSILILSEKILYNDPNVQHKKDILHKKFKLMNGYSNLEIDQKKDALKKILIAETIDEHIFRLRKIGFTNINTIYQCINFSTIIAFKK